MTKRPPRDMAGRPPFVKTGAEIPLNHATLREPQGSDPAKEVEQFVH
jgi:hypothetical protein